MSNKTALEKIVSYLRKRKKGATAPEIAKYAKVNYNTVRKELGGILMKDVFPGLGKCRVTSKNLTTYQLA